MEELIDDLVIDQELSYKYIEKLFGESITTYGNNIIGEQFLVCRSGQGEEYVWSWILVGANAVEYIYRLIYKYTG